MKLRAPLAAFVVALSLAAPAFAAEKSEADRLFDEGTALMNEGKFAEACPKIEQSVKLDPGVGGYLWLADCFERAGKTYSAYKAFKDAEKLAIDQKDPKGRDKIASKRASALEPKLSKLTLVPPTPTPDGLHIVCDGRDVPPAELGTAILVDPGPHTIVIEAPHTKRMEQTVNVAEANSASVVLVLGQTDAPPPPPPVEESGGAGTPMRIVGGALGGVGLVGIVVGSVFGIIASSKLSESNADGHCDDANTCDPIGLAARSQAKDAATVSTIMFIAGGVALAAGITIFALAPSKKSSASVALVPALAPGGGFASLVGRF